MKTAALLVGFFTIVVGVIGLVSPDSLTTARRLYFATPVSDYIRPPLFEWPWGSS